jgi:hypothetical protein
MALRKHRGWKNVTLVHTDALNYHSPRRLDGVLFSLSYSVMENRAPTLHHVWSQLRSGGGYIVILDGKTMPGIVGCLLRALVIAEMKATVLGDPDHNACADLRTLTSDICIEEELFGAYFICQGRKGI